MTLHRTSKCHEPVDPPVRSMSDTMKITLVAVSLIFLVVVARIMDNHYQTQSAAFPIETCVSVDLVHGEIGYTMTSRCALVVKAFKAGRQSTIGLPAVPESQKK